MPNQIIKIINNGTLTRESYGTDELKNKTKKRKVLIMLCFNFLPFLYLFQISKEYSD